LRAVPERFAVAPITGAAMDHHRGRGHRRTDPGLDTAPMLLQHHAARPGVRPPHRRLAGANLFATAFEARAATGHD
jgi:hypothetical protein